MSANVNTSSYKRNAIINTIIIIRLATASIVFHEHCYGELCVTFQWHIFFLSCWRSDVWHKYMYIKRNIIINNNCECSTCCGQKKSERRKNRANEKQSKKLKWSRRSSGKKRREKNATPSCCKVDTDSWIALFSLIFIYINSVLFALFAHSFGVCHSYFIPIPITHFSLLLTEKIFFFRERENRNGFLLESLFRRSEIHLKFIIG